ncbi:hypothetical protein PSYAE_20293 [Pseudomonas amygdali pv. aesculi str. 0893_23]|nr:hypothetical protein PSYAE_20293 [Pseudomonas amygdali pv. aesculi str. 0893_23]
MDMRLHGLVWTGLEGSDEVGLVLVAEIFEPSLGQITDRIMVMPFCWRSLKTRLL